MQLPCPCTRDFSADGPLDEVVRAANNLVVLMSERFLVHNAVHRPLRRLIRSCVGDAPNERVDGAARVVGAAATGDDDDDFVDFEEDLVDLMCILCSRLRAYPPLLLIFFHDRGWLVPHTSSGAPSMPSMGSAGATLSSPAPNRTITTPPRNTTPNMSNAVLSPIRMERTLSPSPSIATGRSWRSARSGETSMSDPGNTHFEFLLFRYLLRFVHREGRIGDFARAGLLFLFDIAFLAPGDDQGGDTLSMAPIAGQDPLQDARDAMAEYILDSDFADIMAAGLGATYSILPTKLRVPSLAEQVRSDPDATDGSMYIGAGEKTGSQKSNGDAEDDDDVIESNDIDVQAQLDLLLRLFGFLQDILYRCHSPLLYADPGAEVTSTQVLGPAVASATLEAVQKTFVDNVLYPSILECSPNDGSSVAILTYLDVLLSNLEDGPVLHRMLDVLMDANAPPPSLASPKRKRKRKTGAMAYVAPFAPIPQGNYFSTEERFTLRDLIIDNLRSSSEAAAAAALHLTATLLSDHCRHVTSKLLVIIREPSATALARPSLPPPDAETWQSTLPPPVTSTDAHLQEPELYSGLIPKLDDVIQSSHDVIGFASYLADAEAFLEADGCWRTSRVPLEFVNDDGHPTLLRVGEYDSDPLQHKLSPTDPLVRQLLQQLGEWFASPPDRNVALTGAISAVARCPHRSLTGWLLYDVPRETDPWDDAVSVSSDDSLAEMRRSGMRSRSDDPFSHVTLPALYQILRQLVKQVNAFRSLEGFDRLLAERRQGLLFADHLEESMSLMAEEAPDVTPKQKGGLAKLKALWNSPGLKRRVSGAPPTPSTAPSTPAGTPTRLPGRRGTVSTPPPRNVSHTGANGTPAGAPGTPSRTAPPLPAPPFKTHYASTNAPVDVSAAQPPQQGPWAEETTTAGLGLTLGDLSLSASARSASGISGDTSTTETDSAPAPERQLPERMSLTTVLDNCVVLEELVKELVAIIVARRAMGIDQVGYV